MLNEHKPRGGHTCARNAPLKEEIAMQNKRRRLSVTMSLVLGIAIAQFGQAQTFKNASVEGGAKTTNQSANWTIMVYVSADGVLTNFAVESLKQLKRAAGDGVVVAAQVDTNGEIPAQRYVFDKSGDLTSLADSKPDGVSPAPSVGTPNP